MDGRTSDSRRMESRRYYMFTAVQIVLVCGLVWFMFTTPGPWDRQRGLGTALMIAGLAGIAVARYQIRRSFAIRAEAHQLVTHGIYSRVRNPIYVFGGLLTAGFILILHRPTGWLFLLAMAVIQTLRARREARCLEAAFGDAYLEYRRKT
jgi:protein-S-isoprenylcysteine O-methyltransferase Ste14